jgi:hypothetical protein
MDARQQRLFGCDCAESVVHLTTDPRVAKCIAVSRRHADGLATGEELRAVTNVVNAAAYVADATNAVYAATRAAFHSAATAKSATPAAAASYAASAAAAAAAFDADSKAVYDAEREKQRHALLALALAGEIQ